MGIHVEEYAIIFGLAWSSLWQVETVDYFASWMKGVPLRIAGDEQLKLKYVHHR